jgi:hypothetical protein
MRALEATQLAERGVLSGGDTVTARDEGCRRTGELEGAMASGQGRGTKRRDERVFQEGKKEEEVDMPRLRREGDVVVPGRWRCSGGE